MLPTRTIRAGDKQFPVNFPLGSLRRSLVLQFYTNVAAAAAASAADVFPPSRSHKLPHLLRQRRFFLFVARYKTGIAALSITRRRGSRMALEAIGSIRTAREIVLNYNFVVTFCILPAPLAGRRGGAQPSRNGSAPHSVPLHSNLSKKESTLPHNS